MPVTIGALRESAPQETRVSVVPEISDKLTQAGTHVLLQRGAGERAQFPDAAYKNIEWSDGAAPVLARSQVILTVQPLGLAEITQLAPGTVVVGFMQAHARAAEVKAMRDRKVTTIDS